MMAILLSLKKQYD